MYEGAPLASRPEKYPPSLVTLIGVRGISFEKGVIGLSPEFVLEGMSNEGLVLALSPENCLYGLSSGPCWSVDGLPLPRLTGREGREKFLFGPLVPPIEYSEATEGDRGRGGRNGENGT